MKNNNSGLSAVVVIILVLVFVVLGIMYFSSKKTEGIDNINKGIKNTEETILEQEGKKKENK